MFVLLSFLFGASLGSFVQVVVTRLHVAPILNTRSKCLSCGSTIKWYDLVPVVSYLVLKGKCRACKNSFGIRSLFIEIVFGAIFICVYNNILLGSGVTYLSLFWLVYYSFLIIVLGVITLYDIAHKMIPNSFFVMFLGLSVAALITRFIQVRDLHVFLAPFAVALPFLLAFIVTKGKALGFGDVLMYMAVGAFLGLEQGLAVLFISVWLGGVTGLVLHFLSKKKYTMKSALPFVPFITLAFVIVLFTDIDIISIGGLLTRWYY